MAAYRERVKADLDRWISAGLVAPDKRQAILASIPETRRLDAATALAWVGGILAGIAIIAFVAANWDGLSRLARFATLLAAFLALAGAAAWAAHKQRPLLANIALTIAALVFAASIGLTGQIFDIVGDPRAASYGAGVAAFALALAGRSTGAACAGLVFIMLGDFADRSWFSGMAGEAPWMLPAAPLAAFLAMRWGSAPLAHVAALGIIFCCGWFAGRMQQPEGGVLLFLAILLGAMAAGARWLYAQDKPFAGVFYGWFAMGALIFFSIAGYLPWFGGEESLAGQVAHRICWISAAGVLIALGRLDRHLMVTAIGVLGLIGAVCALLADLGLDLMAAAGVFLLCAIAAGVGGLMLRRKKDA
jgi:uncharacterized membrane protein